MHKAVKDKTTPYLTAPTTHAVPVTNKPRDMEWSSAKNTSVKHARNQLQDITGRVAARRASTNKDQFQELPKKGIDL